MFMWRQPRNEENQCVRAAKRIASAIISTFLAAHAVMSWAEFIPTNVDGWELALSTEAGHIYIDPQTLKKNWNVRRVWELQNNRSNDSSGAKSIRSLREYDCKENRFRIFSVSRHSEQFARGTVIGLSSTRTDWFYIPPNTVAAEMLKYICNQ